MSVNAQCFGKIVVNGIQQFIIEETYHDNKATEFENILILGKLI